MPITRFGSKQLSKALKAWEEDVIKEVKRVIVETAYLLQAEAVSRAPLDTGDLKQSIEVEILNDGLTAIVTVGVHYAIYVEFGTGIYAVKGDGRKTPWSFYSNKLGEWVWTRGMEAQPFWFPAIDIAKKHFRIEMKKLGL